jgi:hypothetical protein
MQALDQARAMVIAGAGTMNDLEKYRQALKEQQRQRELARIDARMQQLRLGSAHLGMADENCGRCGGLIETLLNEAGREPLRLCWHCEAVRQEAFAV